MIEETKKLLCQTLNKLHIDKSADVIQFKKLTFLTGNLKAVSYNPYNNYNPSTFTLIINYPRPFANLYNLLQFYTI